MAPTQMNNLDPHIVGVVNNLTHEQLCYAWRFTRIPGLDARQVADVFNSNKGYYTIFKTRFDAFGGFTPEISKRIGWDA